MTDAVQKIKEASFAGSDGLDYVETLVALDALKSVSVQRAGQNVLDKIKAEINGKYRITFKDTPKDDWAVRWNDCLDEVLQIIDKYREERMNDNS